MPQFDTHNVVSLEQVHQLEGILGELDLTRPMLRGGVAHAEAPSQLTAYLSTYGFYRMPEDVVYCLGYLRFDGHKVATHVWRSSSGGKATVFLWHGLFDHVGLFLDLVNTLLDSGFHVVAIDFPGHGLSDGESAVIRDFAEYGAVIDNTVEILAATLPAPFYGLGQSTGCAALMNYVLAKRGGRFEKLIFLAPLLRPNAWAWVSLSYFLLHRFLRFVPRKFKDNSHREGFCDFLAHYDPLQPQHISVEWVGAMRAWVKGFSALPSSPVPLLIFQGSSDNTVDWRWNLPRVVNKFTAAKVEMLEGAMHHLANEDDRWRIPMLQKVVSFLQGGV